MRQAIGWFAVAAGIIILCGLGFWQLQRLAEKAALITTIAARVGRPPLPLVEALRSVADEAELEYQPVVVSGRFLNDRELHLVATLDGQPGWHIYAPLQIDNGPLVLVNRGYVPGNLVDPSSRLQTLATGRQTVTGLLRLSEKPGSFVPANDAGRNEWYWRDLAAMYRSIGPAAVTLPSPLVSIDAAVSASPSFPRGGTTRLSFSQPSSRICADLVRPGGDAGCV